MTGNASFKVFARAPRPGVGVGFVFNLAGRRAVVF